jgi:hypothetical protein
VPGGTGRRCRAHTRRVADRGKHRGPAGDRA